MEEEQKHSPGGAEEADVSPEEAVRSLEDAGGSGGDVEANPPAHEVPTSAEVITVVPGGSASHHPVDECGICLESLLEGAWVDDKALSSPRFSGEGIIWLRLMPGWC